MRAVVIAKHGPPDVLRVEERPDPEVGPKRIAAEVRRITGGEGIDLAFDARGPKSFRKDYRLLRSGGRLVVYGYSESESAGGRNLPALLRTLARAPFATMPWWKSLGVMNENRGVFERADKAHRFIAERRNVGKVVLVP